MALNKKERGVTIAVGVTIGVILSWGLLTRWQEDRDEMARNLPGNYDSNLTAYRQPMGAPPPVEIQERYPGGRVLHHVADANASLTLPGKSSPLNIWTLTTKNGKYKFVRVEEAVAVDDNATTELSLYRGAELFAWTRRGASEDDLREILPEAHYNLIGRNERRGCYLIQFREVSPAGLPAAMRELLKKSIIEKVEPCLIE